LLLRGKFKWSHIATTESEVIEFLEELMSWFGGVIGHINNSFSQISKSIYNFCCFTDGLVTPPKYPIAISHDCVKWVEKWANLLCVQGIEQTAHPAHSFTIPKFLKKKNRIKKVFQMLPKVESKSLLSLVRKLMRCSVEKCSSWSKTDKDHCSRFAISIHMYYWLCPKLFFNLYQKLVWWGWVKQIWPILSKKGRPRRKKWT